MLSTKFLKAKLAEAQDKMGWVARRGNTIELEQVKTLCAGLIEELKKRGEYNEN